VLEALAKIFAIATAGRVIVIDWTHAQGTQREMDLRGKKVFEPGHRAAKSRSGPMNS
jgi:hypothetical protein